MVPPPAAGAPAAGAPTSASAPDAETLGAIATPATVRRAPRFGAFIRAGVVVGAVVAWLVAMFGTGTSGEVRTLVVVVTTFAGALVGGLLAAGLAVLADRRSGRR